MRKKVCKHASIFDHANKVNPAEFLVPVNGPQNPKGPDPLFLSLGKFRINSSIMTIFTFALCVKHTGYYAM